MSSSFNKEESTSNRQIKNRLLDLFAKYPAISLKQVGFRETESLNYYGSK